MNIKCPVCRTEYNIGPGKYRCKCGAKFFVKEPEVVLDTSSFVARMDLARHIPEKIEYRPPRRRYVGTLLRVGIGILVGLFAGYAVFQFIADRSAAEEQLAAGMLQSDIRNSSWSGSTERRQYRSWRTVETKRPAEKRLAETRPPAVENRIDDAKLAAESVTSEPEPAAAKEPALPEEKPENEAAEVKFSSDRKILLKVSENITGEYIIPQGVKVIAPYAFADCEKLTAVHIPEGVVRIGEMAFGSCSSLRKVTIPDSVINIEMRAFYQCGSLSQLEIPDSVELLGRGVFTGCRKLLRITLPASFRWKVFHLGLPNYCNVTYRQE